MSPYRFSPALFVLVPWIAAPSPSPAAEMHLKAVKRNGVPITPTSTVGAMPGDLITAEIFVCGWEADEAGSRVKTFQAILANANGVLSGDSGSIFPNGWDAPIENERCRDNAECTNPEYPVCHLQQVSCVGLSHNPKNPNPSPPDDDGTFIDLDRPDLLLRSFDPIPGVRVSEIDFGFGMISLASTGPVDQGCDSLKYGGTTNYRVGPDACGDFEFGFMAEGETFLELTHGPHDLDSPFIEPKTTPLTIRVGSHCDRPVRPVDSLCYAGSENLAFSCGTDDDCGVEGRCATKSRFLSVRVNTGDLRGNVGTVRVKVVDSPDPGMIGDTWWVGPSSELIDAPAPLVLAPLECTRAPFEQDWGVLEGVHIFGEAVVPGARYEVSFCRGGKCLMPVFMDTGAYGDIIAPFGAGQPNLGDISAQMAKLQGAVGQISLTRALLCPSLLDPSKGTSFVQISATVAAFQGLPYADPPSAPGANRCP